MSPDRRITVLISGNGSNLQALIDKAGTPDLPSITIVKVISNRVKAYGRERARNAGISEEYHNLVKYKKDLYPGDEKAAREHYDADLAQMVIRDKPDLVVCAGWMHILAPTFLLPLEQAQIPVINLHPALPGKFNGSHAIHRAYEAFQKGEIQETGIMVHYVIKEVDEGTPIKVEKISMIKDEPEENLENRIHQAEWKLIVEGTRMALDRLQKQ
ncbi:MAG: hypothetical protein M1834_005510 [Cirrosporium novae-zelandiae]|nr:MAG: hypothetical protein M1834_005510 [Cirrosporium novae-zelandiae]